MPPWLVALRPQQWPKNGIVTAALVFSAGDAWELDNIDSWWPLLWRTLVLFGAWCAVASATYLINDAADRERDRQHPRKRHRPIAAGRLGVASALIMAVGLALAGTAIAFGLDAGSGAVVGGYFLVMLAYSGALKAVPVLDVFLLSAGVVARAVSGGLAIEVEISPWLYVCGGFGAFFLATSKRWSEARELGDNAVIHRPALAAYPSEVLSQMLTISAAAALLSYGVYTIESANAPTNGAMALTIPFVGAAMFRYLMLLQGRRSGDAPDQILFTDPGIVACVVGFVVTATWVLLAN